MKNPALLLILLFVQFNISKSDKYINPDGEEWVTIDSVMAFNLDTNDNSPSYFFDLECYDSLNCIGHYGNYMQASSYSIIRKTTNGGLTWFDIRKDTRPPWYPYRRFIFYPEKDLIVIGCDSGYVLRSSDGGVNWDFSQKITTLEPIYFQLNKMYMKGKIGIMHYSGVANAFITEDGGLNWTKMQFNTNPIIRPANFCIIDSNIIIVNSIVKTESDTSMYFFKTTNRGKHWSLIKKINNSENYYSFFVFLNENLGYSRYLKLIHKGSSQSNTRDTTLTAIYKTKNGGVSWDKIYETIDAGNGFGQHNFKDSLNIISTNVSGGYIKTTDGGLTWEKSQYFTFDGIYRVGSCFTNTFLSPTTPIMGYGPLLLKYVGKNTSIDLQKPENSEVIIYPNPSTDFIEISFGNKGLKPIVENVQVQIFDLLGIEIKNLTPALSINGKGVRIDVSALSAGVYYIRIGDKTEKFVKM